MSVCGVMKKEEEKVIEDDGSLMQSNRHHDAFCQVSMQWAVKMLQEDDL